MSDQSKTRTKLEPDQWIQRLSLVALLLTAVPLFSEELYDRFFGEAVETQQAKSIGRILESSNDIRVKSARSLAWKTADSNSEIRKGDSLFTGAKSHSIVELQEGGKVELTENSMVTFNKQGDIEIPNLALGNFKIAVSGKMKIAINGQVTEVEGDGSEIKINVEKDKAPQIQLTKGTAQIAQKGKPKQRLNRNVATILPKTPKAFSQPVLPPELPAQKLAKIEIVPVSLQAKISSQVLEWREKLEDTFQLRDQTITRRSPRRSIVPVKVSAEWSSQGEPEQVFGQLSSSRDFGSITSWFATEAASEKFAFDSASLGKNYVRLSADRKTWTAPVEVEVVSQPLRSDPLRLAVKNSKPIFLNEPITVRLDVEAPTELTGFVVETSPVSSFEIDETELQWLTARTFTRRIEKPGRIFVRIRGVNDRMEVTAPSEVAVIEPIIPALPKAPFLARQIFYGDEDRPFWVNWDPADDAAFYSVSINTQSGQRVLNSRTEDISFRLKDLKKGTYILSLTSTDAYSRVSTNASSATVIVRPRYVPPPEEAPKPLPALASATPPPAPLAIAPEPMPIVRTPSNTITSTLSRKTFSQARNAFFQSLSRVTLDTAGATKVSQDQLAEGLANPVGLNIGGRILHWFGGGQNGFEGSISTKAATVTAPGGENGTPTRGEARYLHRWRVPFNPLAKGSTSQLSLLAGVESYRNPGTKYFSPKYDIAKTGLKIDFPVLSNWGTGGEVAYGRGLDGSTNVDVAGYVDYFLQHKLSVGFGYRVQLFDAGSAASAPVTVPYREAQGEGFSQLRWHY